MLSTLLASATVLPCPTITSMALTFFMICSGVCLFFFISCMATRRVAYSHNTWYHFWGPLHGDRCTARAVCRHMGLNRSTYAYRAKEADAWEAKLKGALRRKSNEHPELGYAKITRLLKQEGWQVGARNVQRLRRELGLAVPAKKPKRRRQGESTELPAKGKYRGHVWT